MQAKTRGISPLQPTPPGRGRLCQSGGCGRASRRVPRARRHSDFAHVHSLCSPGVHVRKKRTSKVVNTQLARMTVRKFMQSCTPNTPNRVHMCAKRVHVCRKRSRLRAPARSRRWKQVVAAPLRPVSLRASTPRGQDPVRRPQSSGEEPTFCSRPRTEVRHLPTVFRTEQKIRKKSPRLV